MSAYGTDDLIHTIDCVPTSPGYIRVLTAERLEQLRPSVQIPVDNDEELFSAAPLLNAVIKQAPQQNTHKQQESENSVLDDGRVSLRHAIRSFGWDESTQLSFTVEGNHVSVYAISGEGSTLESKQGRCLIPLAIRRRLSLQKNSTVYVVTEHSPVPHVRIYSNALVLQLLGKED